MRIENHTLDTIKVAEIISDDLVIKTNEDALSLLGDLYYQGFDSIIIQEKNITTYFFDLKNGMAGEILQKFSNYRIRLAIVGDFSSISSKSLKDFIFESNKNKQIIFVNTIEKAIDLLSN